MERRDLTGQDMGGETPEERRECMKCSIVKELLLSFRDGLTSEETNADIREHLNTCSACQAYEKELSQRRAEASGEKDALELLEKLQAHIRRNRIIAAASACVLLLCLVIFARTYGFPLPFDRNRMVAEPMQGVVISEEDSFGEKGALRLYDLDSLDLETTRRVLEGEYGIVESVKLSIRGINDVQLSSRSRVVERDGEKIKVLYFCCYKTLWGSIFQGDFAPYRESLSVYGLTQDALIQDRGAQDGKEEKISGYEPMPTEVYYLPIRNLSEKLESLSDEAYDAMRQEGTLVWSGSAV